MFFKLSDARYHKLVAMIEALEERHLQLKAQHEALRSRYYATRGEPKDPPPPHAGSRAEKDQVLTDFLAGRRTHDAAR